MDEFIRNRETREVCKIVRVEVGTNGMLDVIGEASPGRFIRAGFWRWRDEDAKSFYDYVDKLSRVAGWRADFRELIFGSLAIMKANRDGGQSRAVGSARRARPLDGRRT